MMDETQQQYIERIARMTQMPTKASEIFTTEDQMVAAKAIALWSAYSSDIVQETLATKDEALIEKMLDNMLSDTKAYSIKQLKELSS